jgi:hypothetical protein
MSELTDKETITVMCDSIKQAASAARQLGKRHQKTDFLGIAMILEEIEKKARILAEQKMIDKITLESALKRHSKIAPLIGQ